MEALVSNIQRFSTDDGAGIRTTVFLKGCNLHCEWCHNPECISAKPELQFQSNICTYCGACAEVCPVDVHCVLKTEHQINRANCFACGRCVEACRSHALAICGHFYDTKTLMRELYRDRQYYTYSGGGVTFSGGEPLLQKNFLREILMLCKKAGFHTAVDTAGCVSFASFEEILPYTDLFLYDIKAFHEQLHIRGTGSSNSLILENLPKLLALGALVDIRIPIIQEYNGTLLEMEAIADYLSPLPVHEIRFLPYHNYGSGKYQSLARQAPRLSSPDEDFLENAATLFQNRGMPVAWPGHFP